jgi:hypothetical protein
MIPGRYRAPICPRSGAPASCNAGCAVVLIPFVADCGELPILANDDTIRTMLQTTVLLCDETHITHTHSAAMASAVATLALEVSETARPEPFNAFQQVPVGACAVATSALVIHSGPVRDAARFTQAPPIAVVRSLAVAALIGGIQAIGATGRVGRHKL